MREGSDLQLLAQQVLQGLRTTKHLSPCDAWLGSFLSTQRPGLPLNALVSTAGFRLLATDMKTSLDIARTAAFPVGMVDPSVKEARLPGPLVVQLLDIEDLGRSRWSQLEDIDADERGERTKGREIIRLAASSSITASTSNLDEEAALSEATGGNHSKSGPHRLLVEDMRGTKVYAIETRQLKGVHVGMHIGTKLLLTDVTVARGVLLLDPQTTTTLGGKIDHLHQHWKDHRKEMLKTSLHSQDAAVTLS